MEERLQLSGRVEKILQKDAYTREALLRDVREWSAKDAAPRATATDASQGGESES